MNEKKLLIITPCLFHNEIGHAGGKTMNYYVKSMTSTFDVTVLTLGERRSPDFDKMKKDHPNITFIAMSGEKNIFQRIRDFATINYIYPKLKFLIPHYFLSNGFQKRRLNSLLQSINKPEQFDFVLVEYTQLIFHIDLIKKHIPNAKYIASSHDVTTQAVERYINSIKIHLYPNYFKNKFKQLESKYLSKFDLVVVQNRKDEIILQEHLNINSKKTYVISPYFDQYSLTNIEEKDGIVFFGAMGREENKTAVLWFLEKIWNPFCIESKHDLKFYIIGGGLDNKFTTKVNQYKNTILTGFVKNPNEFFDKSYTMVIPLQTGAGIKVKTIEAMYSGLTVLTNQLGIEGIYATSGQDYLHCESINDWLIALKQILIRPKEIEKIGLNGQKFIHSNFNLVKSSNNYIEKILSLK